VAHRLILRLQRDEPVVLALVGTSPAMRELAAQVDLLAHGDRAAALLIGESGTGKGEIAEYIHARGPRSALPFLEINCATTPAAVLTEELFGSLASSDPGPGLLDAVHGGTIFINEVSDLNDDLQSRLLRTLDESGARASASGEGSVSVIAAASKDLVNEVNTQQFREDLYYRLSGAPLHVPPLRARSREDLAELITATFRVITSRISRSPTAIGDDVLERLVAHPWPGNIRELRNALERAVLAARGETTLHWLHLPAELRELNGGDMVYIPRTLVDMERAHIHRTLHAHNLNRTHAARDLGISRATLIRKIKEYGLSFHIAGSA
jgi:DNA-binding NtrC family response regulator